MVLIDFVWLVTVIDKIKFAIAYFRWQNDQTQLILKFFFHGTSSKMNIFVALIVLTAAFGNVTINKSKQYSHLI